MTWEYLREFITLAEVGNFTDAADQLFLSQSTLSRHIKEFETNLGVRLFTRTTKNVVLNEYGEKFFPYAQHILSVQDECLRAFTDEIHRMDGKLRIGIFVFDEQYKYTNIINNFRAKYPKYEISLIEDRAFMLKDRILKGTCDFAIITNQLDRPLEDIESITILQDSLVAILPQDHPLAQNDAIDLEQLKDETVIMQDEASSHYHQYTESLQRLGFSPVVKLCSLNTKGIIKMVEQGEGVTLRPKLLATGRHNTSTKMLDIRPALPINIDLIYRRDKARTEAENALIQFFRDTLNEEQS